MSIRSKNKTTAAIAAQSKASVIVARSNKHFSAQIISKTGVVLAGANTKSKPVQKLLGKDQSTSNCNAANLLGKHIASLIKSLKIDNIAFNRSGLIYHGRVAAFVTGMRDSGVKV